MKLSKHENCPRDGAYSFGSGGGYRGADVLRLYVRDPKTRQMVGVGQACRRCGAVQMDGWQDFALVGGAVSFPPRPRRG